MLEYDKIDINEGINVNKINYSVKNLLYVTIGILLIEILIIKNTYAMVVTICL